MFYNDNSIPPFFNWAYNPQYINQQAYLQYQAQILAYERQQNYEVIKTAHKLKEYIDAAKKVDSNHSAELFAACLAVIAEEMHWNK